MRQIAHIELHDAHVSQISLMAGGVLRIVFDHICVYFRVAEETDEIWSVRATIDLESVETLEVRGVFQNDDYISEGDLLDERGADLGVIDMETIKGAKRLNLLFAGSGTKVQISMERARFQLDAMLKMLEIWHGPLRHVEGAGQEKT